MRLRVHADEIRPGDVIRYKGHRHRIAGVSRRPGWAWSIAIDGDGWAIALDDRLVSVWRGWNDRVPLLSGGEPGVGSTCRGT